MMLYQYFHCYKRLIDSLIDYLFLKRPAQEIFTYMEMSPVMDCKIKAHARRSGPLNRGDLYRATPAVYMFFLFFGLIRPTAQFNACYNLQGNVDDLFFPGSSPVPISLATRPKIKFLSDRPDRPTKIAATQWFLLPHLKQNYFFFLDFFFIRIMNINIS
jgi:hypothetical protein